MLYSLCFIVQIHTPGYAELDRSIHFECPGNGMAIFLTKKHLPNFNHSSFHLNNNSCTGQQLNHSHIILQTGLNDCGTVNRSYNGSFIYTNLVHGYLKNTDNHSLKNIASTFVVECNRPSELEKSNRTSPKFDVTVSNVASKKTSVKDVPSLQSMQLQAGETSKTIIKKQPNLFHRHVILLTN